MSVASCLNGARQARASSLPALISRTAGYAIRMSGGVGGGGREVTPYPYLSFFYYVTLNIEQVLTPCACSTPSLSFNLPSTVAIFLPICIGLASHLNIPVSADTGLIKFTLTSIVVQLKPFESVDRTAAVIVVSSNVERIPPCTVAKGL